MSTLIKSIGKSGSRFAVNGKLCVLKYGPNQTVESIKYSSELNSVEEKEFKGHLEVLKLI